MPKRLIAKYRRYTVYLGTSFQLTLANPRWFARQKELAWLWPRCHSGTFAFSIPLGVQLAGSCHRCWWTRRTRPWSKRNSEWILSKESRRETFTLFGMLQSFCWNTLGLKVATKFDAACILTCQWKYRPSCSNPRFQSISKATAVYKKESNWLLTGIDRHPPCYCRYSRKTFHWRVEQLSQQRWSGRASRRRGCWRRFSASWWHSRTRLSAWEPFWWS